ncbi:MAG: SCO family protein [Candidatus Neomarinimicrobiota bacterium]
MTRLVYYFLLAIVVLAIGANWVIDKANNSYDFPLLRPIPEFSFFNQYGEHFSNNDFKHKITILDFIFTSCTGPCPIMSLNMFKLYKDFDDVEEVQFVSITVDPSIDNRDKLSEYAEIIGVKDERWQFLWSDINSIKDLKKNGFMLFSDNLPQGHAIKFVLIDYEGNIRQYYDGTDDASQEVLRKDITKLVRKLRS